MKILVVSRYFYPINSPRSFRTTELVKELCRQGHDVTVAMPYSSSDHDKIAQNFGFKILDTGIEPVFKQSNTSNVFMSLLHRAYSRFLSLYFMFPSIVFAYKVKNTIQKLSGFDYMISIAMPHTTHWGVAMARSTQHPIATTWIADCGDPFMGSTTDSFKKPFYFKYVEKWWCKKADFISVPINGAISAYYPEFHSKIRVVPQGFKFEETYALLNPYKKNAVPTFAYAGSFIKGLRDPRPILAFLNSLDFDFKLHLFNNQVDLTKPYADASKGRILIHDKVSRDKLIPILGEMDFLLNIENNVSEALPSKLIDYFLTGRPVLSINSNTPDFETLKAFLSGNYEGQLRHPEMAQYEIGTVVRSFFTLAKNVDQE